MTITVLLTVAGTVVIFVHVKGWSSVRHKINSKSLKIRKHSGVNIVFKTSVETRKNI